MKLKTYDCAIIGAGPAGATAAYELARLGRTVALIERDKLPRYKPCGGGVSPQIQDWLDFDLSPTISCVAGSIRATWRMGDPVEGEIPDGGCVWMVRREEFDFFLARRAVEHGAELWDETAVLGARWSGRAWELLCGREGFTAPSDGLGLTARFVIAADGAKGRAAKWLGLANRKRRLAGAYEVEAPPAYPEPRGLMHLEFGMIRGGYLWSFPKADGHSVGIGAFKGQAPPNMKEILFRYADSLGIPLDEADRHGHPVAVWDGDFPLHGCNCLLAGEAACVVDPFTAEGIRPAMFSGLRAARAIHGALSSEGRALEAYSDIMRKEHGTDMRWARRVARLFYTFPKVAYDYGVKDPSALGFLGKLVSGKARYRDIARPGMNVLESALAGRQAV